LNWQRFLSRTSTMSTARRGRLLLRRALPSYLPATRHRYQRSNVSGVTGKLDMDRS
jgi:hypothetical protein